MMTSLDEIAQSLQGYDPQALKTEDANAFIAKLVSPISVPAWCSKG